MSTQYSSERECVVNERLVVDPYLIFIPIVSLKILQRREVVIRIIRHERSSGVYQGMNHS